MIITAIKRSFTGRGKGKKFVVIFFGCLIAFFLSFCFLLFQSFRFAIVQAPGPAHSSGLIFPVVTPKGESYALISGHPGGLTPETCGGIARDLLSFVANVWPGTGALDRFCTSEGRYTGKHPRDL